MCNCTRASSIFVLPSFRPCLQARSAPGQPPDGVLVHRRMRGDEDDALLYDVRCRPLTQQAQEVLAAIQAVRFRCYVLPRQQATGWRDALQGQVQHTGMPGGYSAAGLHPMASFAQRINHRSGAGLNRPMGQSQSPDSGPSEAQSSPASLLCSEFRRVWMSGGSEGAAAGSSSRGSGQSWMGRANTGTRPVSIWRPMGPPG